MISCMHISQQSWLIFYDITFDIIDIILKIGNDITFSANPHNYCFCYDITSDIKFLRNLHFSLLYCDITMSLILVFRME